MAPQNDDESTKGSNSESTQKSVANTLVLNNQQLRSNANAPTSAYPPASTNEYAPHPGRQPPLDAQGHPRTHAFTLQSMFPPIVTLTGRPTRPPRAPNRNDERCITYCTQTAARRELGAQPICKTLCWRRLFPQDLTFVETDDDENDRKHSDQSPTVGDSTQKLTPGLFGFDGRFVYFGRSRFRAKDRMDSMSGVGLSVDTPVGDMVPKNSVGANDAQYMEFLRRYHYSTQIEIGPLPATIYSHVAERVEQLFAPFIRTSTVYLKSFEREGVQERFAKRVWEKTQNGETWALAKKIGSKLWESISSGGGNDSGPATPQ